MFAFISAFLFFTFMLLFFYISYLKVFLNFLIHFFNTFKIDPIFQRNFDFIFDSVLCASNSEK